MKLFQNRNLWVSKGAMYRFVEYQDNLSFKIKLSFFLATYLIFWITGFLVNEEASIAWRLFGLFVPILGIMFWGGLLGFVVYFISLAGIYGLMTWRGIPIMGSIAGPTFAITTLLMVTGFRKLILDLYRLRNHLRLLTDSVPVMISYIDREGRFQFCSTNHGKWMSSTPGNFIGKEMNDVWPPEAFSIIKPRLEAAFSGEEQSYELEHDFPDGIRRILKIVHVPDFDEKRKVRGLSTMVEDVTRQKLDENRLKESESNLLKAQEIAHLGSWEWDICRNTLHWSNEIFRIFGVRPQDFGATYESFIAFVHPNDREFVASSVDKAVNEGLEYNIEHRIVRPSGTVRHVHEQGEVIFDGDSRPLRMMGTVQDVTERKNAEEALRASEQRFRDFAESASDWLWEMGPDLRFTYFSKRMEEVVGVPISFHIGKSRLDLASQAEDTSYWDEHLGVLEKHLPFHDFRYWRKGHDGRLQYLSTSGKPVFGEGSQFMGYRGVGSDITAKKNTEDLLKFQEQQLIQADKMTSLGILVSGVAHEINNPTNFIMFNVPILQKLWSEIQPVLNDRCVEMNETTLAGMPVEKLNETVSRLLQGVSNGAERIRNIVANLKNFAQPSTNEEFIPLDLNKIIQSAVTLMSNEIKLNTDHFHMELEEDLQRFEGEFQKIEQVVINLLNNACQSLADKNHAVMVKTVSNREEQKISLIVADEGRGVSRENMKMIVDPFFTTKRDTGGTGLGLSVSYRIIKEHRGSLDFSSEEGGGTTVVVSLPAVLSSPPTGARSPAAAQPAPVPLSPARRKG